ncbi:PhnD/SsuA/transferrin family substrate-binding protein [Marinospirillum alkaliphilum]|uniref:PhnD/SsuA/transferrin family substrate-binding protein n=1 Tax=Marinospirillum alkaliphilum TaxID=148454 RepID=UPI000AAAA4B0|nr:PhnD/SsuA/transferrin family substrate-binding protein [Marinospirillum alkaliphilum]
MLLLLPLGSLAAEKRQLHLGVFAYRPAEQMQERFQPLVDYLNEHLQQAEIRLQVLDQAALTEAVHQRKIDLVMTNPSHYNLLRHHYALQGPLVTLVNLEQGIPTRSLGGVILARANNGISDIKHLRQQQIAIPGTWFLGGYQTQVYELMQHGLLPHQDYTPVELGSHDAVIKALLAGHYAVGFVRTGILESMLHQGVLASDQLQVLNPMPQPDFPFQVSTRLYPEWPLAAVGECSCTRELVRALLNLSPDHPAVLSLGIDGFSPPADYSVMDRLAYALKLPPYDQAEQLSMQQLWRQYPLWMLSISSFLAFALAFALALLMFNRRLRLANHRFNSLYQHLPLPVIMLDPLKGVFVDCNPAMPRLLGLSNAQQLIGKRPEEVSPVFQPDGSRSAVLAAAIFRKLQDQESASFEWVHLKQDGHVLLVEVTLIPVEIHSRKLVLGVIHDVTRRREAEQALEQKNQALEASNAELEQFAYITSHDLRQPLRMISSYLQLLERKLADGLAADTREMLHYALDGSRRLDQMLVSLLEYSRVGRKGQPKALLSAQTAINEALQFLEPLIQEQQARIQLLAKHWPTLYVSPDELTRLFQNLIGNALKYHQPGQSPEVRLDVEPLTPDGAAGFWCFTVEDQGIGIAPDQIERLFRVFQRLHTRTEYEGTGIGLAVCRKIVERYGGRIWVESPGEGKGCRFCFTLPVAREGL